MMTSPRGNIDVKQHWSIMVPIWKLLQTPGSASNDSDTGAMGQVNIGGLKTRCEGNLCNQNQ